MLSDDASRTTSRAVVAAERTIYTGFDGMNDTFGQKDGRTTDPFLPTATDGGVT